MDGGCIRAGLQLNRLALLGFWDWALVLTFARTCSALGIRVFPIQVSDNPQRYPSFGCLEASHINVTWDEMNDPSGPEMVRGHLARIGADAVFSADEGVLVWLARNRSLLSQSCYVMAGPVESYEALFSKRAQLVAAQAAGFDVLPNWDLSGSCAGSEAPPPTAYPICLRPSEPNSVTPAFKAKAIRSPAELDRFLASLDSIRSPIMASTFQAGPNVVVHAARDIDGKMLGLEGFLARRRFQGVALSLERFAIPAALADSCSRFAAEMNVVGTFHFDLICSQPAGRLYFLEINPRMGGSTAKVSMLGYDESRLALQSFGFSVAPNLAPLPRVSRVTSKRALVSHIYATLVNKNGELDYPAGNRWRSLATSILELISGHDPVLKMDEPIGSLWYLFHQT